MAVIRIIVEQGGDVNATNKKGNTCLHYSNAYGFKEVTQYLIGCGANEFAVNKDGLTCYEGLSREDLDKI